MDLQERVPRFYPSGYNLEDQGESHGQGGREIVGVDVKDPIDDLNKAHADKGLAAD